MDGASGLLFLNCFIFCCLETTVYETYRAWQRLTLIRQHTKQLKIFTGMEDSTKEMYLREVCLKYLKERPL